MRKTIVNKGIIIALLVLLLAVPLASACARPASTPSSTPAPAVKGGPAAVPKANPLAQVIEGAKKEGTVSLLLSTAHSPTKMVELLKKNIRDKYGVDLDIQVTGALGQAQELATAIMEYQTGVVPSYDLFHAGSDLLVGGMKAGIFEKVDWGSLLEPGTSPEVLPKHPDLRDGIIIIWSGMTGIMYNPKKISQAEVAKSLADLADPKWKGRLGILSYAAYWTRWAFLLGKDKTIATLREIMKNKPVLGTMEIVNNRYLIGEVDLTLISPTFLTMNQEKNMPAAWQILDFIDSRDFQVAVPKGAKHPNAAKLIAIYFASPEGIKYNVDQGGKGSRYLPGNLIYDSVTQAKKMGIPVYTMDHPGLLDFINSPTDEQWQKEIQLILKGGG